MDAAVADVLNHDQHQTSEQDHDHADGQNRHVPAAGTGTHPNVLNTELELEDWEAAGVEAGDYL